MEKLTTIMIVMLLSSVTWAQDDAISKFFSKYNDDPEFTQVSVTSKMFGLFTHFEPEDEDEEAVKNAISKLTGLKILVLEDTQRGKDLYDEAFSLLPKNDYEELMSMKEPDGELKFMIKEKNGIIAELLMIRGGHESFFILSLVGEIDLKEISKLSRHMDIDGFQHLRKIDDN